LAFYRTKTEQIVNVAVPAAPRESRAIGQNFAPRACRSAHKR
jgi:hypothetical protein